MKKFILVFIVYLFIIFPVNAQWEYISFKKDWVTQLGFDGTIVYANCWTHNKGNGVFISHDKGISFKASFGGPMTYDFLEFNHQMLRAGNWLYITKDSGATWKSYSLYGSLATPTIYALAKKDTFVFAAVSGIQKESNPSQNRSQGNHWPNILDTTLFSHIRKMKFWNDTLFVAQSIGRIIYSPDIGETWDTCTKRPVEINRSSLYAFDINNDYIFTGFEKYGIYRSSNRGNSWERVGLGIVNDSVFSIIADNSNIVAGTYNGVFFSTDNGDTWSSRNYGLDSLFILTLEFYEDEIWVGTNSGLYKMKKDIMFTSINKEKIVDISIQPNPATDFIDISGDIAGEVKVYDVLGVCVLTHPCIPSQEGTNTRLDVSGLAAGVYFVCAGDKVLKFVKM